MAAQGWILEGGGTLTNAAASYIIGGSGYGGGTGVFLNGGTLENDGTILGGAARPGSAGSQTAGGGAGYDGGTGVSLTAPTTLANTGMIVGGSGGNRRRCRERIGLCRRERRRGRRRPVAGVHRHGLH